MAINRWTIKEMTVEDLKVYADNPRVISNKHFQGLINSVRRFGLVEPIVWNRRTGQVVSGHQRLRVLVEMGITKTKVLVVDMDPAEAEVASLTMNNPSVEGEFDEPIRDLLQHLRDEDGSMFKELSMDSLMKALDKDLKDIPSSLEDDGDDLDVETTCPCCGNKWEVTVEDVSLESSTSMVGNGSSGHGEKREGK